MEKKKILILLADVNNGHRSAANALINVFDKKYKGKFDIEVEDLFKWADVEPFNTSDASYSLFTRNSTLLRISNFFFKLFNTEFVYNFFYKYTNNRLYIEAYKLIKKEKPDLIISVHPIVSMVVKELKKQTNLFKSVTVITDLITLMRGWADDASDLVICPTMDAVNTLVRYGVDINKITYPLFPINPNFNEIRDKKKILKEVGLSSEKPIILITGGGGGTSTMFKHIKELAKREELQLLIVTAKQEVLRSELELRFKKNKNVKVMGYVNNMQDLMSIADIIIGKPGPATILEIELLNKKAILTNPVGEQEVGNINYALRNPRFRYVGKDFSKLDDVIEDLLKASTFNSHDKPRRKKNESEIIVDSIVKLISK